MAQSSDAWPPVFVSICTFWFSSLVEFLLFFCSCTSLLILVTSYWIYILLTCVKIHSYIYAFIYTHTNTITHKHICVYLIAFWLPFYLPVRTFLCNLESQVDSATRPEYNKNILTRSSSWYKPINTNAIGWNKEIHTYTNSFFPQRNRLPPENVVAILATEYIFF